MNQIEDSSIKQFDHWANWFDSLVYPQFYFSNKYVLDILKPEPKSSLLDIGCGTGILLEQILNRNNQNKLYGIDISPGMIDKARKKLGNSASLKVGSANSLPYGNNSFDYVTCCTSLHHHPDTEQSIREMYRVVKPHGKVAILDIYTDGLARKIIYRLDNFIFREGRTFAYTSTQMRMFFEKDGFKNIIQHTQSYAKLLTIGEK